MSNEPKWTTGPWEAVANGGDDPDERCLLVGKDDQYGSFTMIADCRQRFVHDEIGGDLEANARLISAAPELYAHARDLLFALDRGYLNYKPDQEESAFVSNLRNVLAKARGEP